MVIFRVLQIRWALRRSVFGSCMSIASSSSVTPRTFAAADVGSVPVSPTANLLVMAIGTY